MVFQLHGSPISTCTKRVATVLHEKGVPFEFHPVDFFKGEHKSPEYLKYQPFGQLPYINDDGFILYESRAICAYIATKYANQGTPLIPTELKANALYQQALSTEVFAFSEYADKAVAETVFKPYRGLTPDKATFDKLIASLSANLDVYDQILSKQKYLGGEELTLADLYHLPYGSMLPVAGSNVIETKPHVAKWFNDLASRPSWQAVKDGIKSTA
jgi:glutathione S-transferase